ncbi:MAG: hypothetical protein U0936_11260 [Planctomycetaceae bacterium]
MNRTRAHDGDDTVIIPRRMFSTTPRESATWLAMADETGNSRFSSAGESAERSNNVDVLQKGEQEW